MPSVGLCLLALVVACAALFRAFADRVENRRTIRRLRAEADRAMRLTRARGQLASEIAHEIKNPLTAIQCSAETLDLLVGKEMDPDLRRSLHYIRDYSAEVLRLLSDFLEVSRCEAGAVEAKLTDVQVSGVVDAVAGLLRATAMKKQIRLVAVAMDPQLCVHADPRHLKQILFNLLHNAIKFTPESGTIVVEAHQREGTVYLAVRDNGPGIPHSALRMIFNPYARYEGNQPALDAGSGIGLSLCAHLVRLSNGTISVDSAPGRGSTFTVALAAGSPLPQRVPALGMALAAPKQETNDGFKPLLGQQFLVVDRDSNTRDAIARLITAWGGMVDQVGKALDAVEAISEKSYDAVVVDSTSDGVPCYDVASLLRERVGPDETTIILCPQDPADEHRALHCGADDTIEKPLQSEKLLGSLLHSGKCQITH